MIVFPVAGAVVGATSNWAARHFWGDSGQHFFGAFILGAATATALIALLLVRSERRFLRELEEVRAEFHRRVVVPAELSDPDRG